MKPETPAAANPLERVVMPDGPRLVGSEDLRRWLFRHGFRIGYDRFAGDTNECNWYAYRHSDLPARECETNCLKTAQIVIHPYSWMMDGHRVESVQVDVTGEALNGIWFKLAAYSLNHDELKSRLDDIERALVAAWNALSPDDLSNAYPGDVIADLIGTLHTVQDTLAEGAGQFSVDTLVTMIENAIERADPANRKA